MSIVTLLATAQSCGYGKRSPKPHFDNRDDRETLDFGDTALPVVSKPLGSYTDLFSINNIVKIELKIPDDHWNLLKNQHPKYPCQPDQDKDNHGYPMYSADITINGETIPHIGVRKRNHCGSENKIRPGLSVKFDEFTKNQKFLGSSSLMLNNSWQDVSLVRQCLAFYILAKLGQPYSLCSFAQVYVNQLDPVIYVNVEAIKKPYLTRNFPDQKVATFEGAVSGADLTSEGLKNIEAKDDDAGIDIISNIVDAIHNKGEPLEKHIDVEQFLGFWAAELILAHWDGYVRSKNNFYMIRRVKDQKLKFVVAGTDQVFTEPFTGSIATYSGAFLPQKLLTNPEMRGKLKTELKKGLSKLNPEVLKEYIQSMHLLLTPHLSANLRQQTSDEVDKLLNKVTTHLKSLELAADQL